MKVVVIGTGYVGLVTGTCLSEVGHDVICMDIDAKKVERLQHGETPIYEPGLPELVQKNSAAGRLHFTTSLQEIGQPAVIFFALPTPPNGDGDADLSYVLSAAKDVANILDSYTVLVNKSTVPVGTAQKVHDVVAAETSVAFDVVSNPEFLKEGFAISDFMNADRIVVGASSDKALKVMQELYQPFTTEGIPLIVMDEASSEMTKYAANSFLATKISFMNEIANLCELTGANVDKVREGIGADERIGKRFLYAGIGYGGSCFPKDVLALHHSASSHDYDFKILTAVMDVNVRQKKILVQKVVDRMGEDLSGKTFALWGLAFKPDTDDIREAPSLEIIRELIDRGAAVQAYDPEAADNVRRIFPAEITYANNASDALQNADALLVVTEWKEFIAIEPQEIKKALRSGIVFDGRNIFDPQTMIDAGLTYLSIGRRQ
jgi:UDPglucose 6-dehydrogenase